MDEMSPHILCLAGLKCARCRQVARKYARDYKKARWKAGVYVETLYDITSILEVG